MTCTGDWRVFSGFYFRLISCIILISIVLVSDKVYFGIRYTVYYGV